MVNTVVQLTAYVLCYTGLCGLIASTCMTEWKITVYGNGAVVREVSREGLWMECTSGAGPELTCTPFLSVLHQPSEYPPFLSHTYTHRLLCTSIRSGVVTVD